MKRVGPAWVILNTIGAAFAFALWKLGLLSAFGSIGRPEMFLLGVLGAVFLASQVLILRGAFDDADTVAKFLPIMGIVFLILLVTHAMISSDLSTPGGKDAFVSGIIISMLLTGSAVGAMGWCEVMIWMLQRG